MTNMCSRLVMITNEMLILGPEAGRIDSFNMPALARCLAPNPGIMESSIFPYNSSWLIGELPWHSRAGVGVVHA